MSFPKIGYRSILEASTMSGSVMSGYPLSNLVDRKSYTVAMAPNLSGLSWDFDMGATIPSDIATANYIAIAGANLAAENVTLDLYASNIFPPAFLRASIAPSDYPTSGVFIKEFGSQTLRYWRVTLSAATANPAYIGVLHVGQILTLTENLTTTVDPAVEEMDVALERGDTGHALGAGLRGVIRRFSLDFGGEAGVSWSDLAAANALNDFWKNHARWMRPFFFHTNIAAPTFFDPLYLVLQANAARLDRGLVGGLYARRHFIMPVESAIAEAA